MRQISLITISTVLWLFIFSVAYATEKNDCIHVSKDDCIYASNIDQMISFYQGRLYLLDSEYTILSDVGKDAIKMINCLQGQKERLVKEMKEKKIDFNSKKMRAYVVNRARFSDVGFGYTEP